MAGVIHFPQQVLIHDIRFAWVSNIKTRRRPDPAQSDFRSSRDSSSTKRETLSSWRPGRIYAIDAAVKTARARGDDLVAAPLGPDAAKTGLLLRAAGHASE